MLNNFRNKNTSYYEDKTNKGMNSMSDIELRRAHAKELEHRIEEMESKIAEHERDGTRYNYTFYVEGVNLYRELNELKDELKTSKRYIF